MSDVNTEEKVSPENDDADGKVTETKGDGQPEEGTHDAADKHPHETHENQSAGAAATVQQKTKIDVLLKPAGDAPIMKKKKWAVDRTKRVCWISEFIRKYIKLDIAESLFLYVNQSFSPSPDTEVGVLFDCFGSDGKLVLHYCKSQAWG